jgi:hypothetical protein
LKSSEIFERIYKDIFNNTFSKACYVFLCGGAGEKNMRDIVRPGLESLGFQVFYPEDLFIEMLNRDKKSDLLEYENLLADNSTIICIICESIGSAVELGAFVQNDNIKQKLIVAIEHKHSRQKSFVMMGPVKHLQKSNNDGLVVFNRNDPDTLIKELAKNFHKKIKHLSDKKTQSFKKLSAYIALIPIVVYFYQAIDRKDVFSMLKSYLTKINDFPSDYNKLFNTSINYLIKSGILITDFNIQKNDEVLSLSRKGNNEMYYLITRSVSSTGTYLHDKIRCAILKEQLNN